MNSYLLVLGRASKLCIAELQALIRKYYPDTYLKRINLDIVKADFSADFDAGHFIRMAGGIVKIAEYKFSKQDVTGSLLADLLTQDLNFTSKSVFGLSNYSTVKLPLTQLLLDIKHNLLSKYPSIRFVGHTGQILSSVVVNKQQVNELILAFNPEEQSWYYGKTLVVQDFQDWSLRDFSRPAVNPHTGMLPPKIARNMINLADSYINTERKTLLDPFCGVGTIVAEALLIDWKVIGADISDIQIQNSQANIDWLIKTYPYLSQNHVTLLQCDATHLTKKLAGIQIDAIVTEPFLGFPLEKVNDTIRLKNHLVTLKELINIFKGLTKLYIGCFREWRKILKSNSPVVVVVPEINFQNQVISVKNLVDTCEKLSYTLAEGPYVYRRPQAIISRRIYVFKSI